MADEKEILNTTEIEELSNELTYQRYLVNNSQLREFFRKVSVPEYVALHKIAAESEPTETGPGKTYLKDLAEKMHLTISQTSKMVEKLTDQGLLLWQHDGNGSQGTYVTITCTGQKLLQEQEQFLRDYYGKVIGKFGKENVRQLVLLMRQLEEVMSEEIKRIEEEKE